MEEIIKTAAQLIFAIVAIIFVVYSVAAIYALNAYGRTKTFTSAVSISYSAIVMVLLGWGFISILSL